MSRWGLPRGSSLPTPPRSGRRRVISHVRTRQRHREWLLLTLALLGLVAALTLTQALPRLNHLVQDAALRLLARPAHPDIVLITIDERSIAAIGRWPWRRALHAELIQRISAQQPRAIGMDILLNEEDFDYPADDRLLADALERSGKVVLPVIQRRDAALGPVADLPWPAFAQAAAGLGHVHVAPDSDGVVRGHYAEEGTAAMLWPHFSVTLRCVAEGQGGCAGLQSQADLAPPAPGTPSTWQRSQHTLIAFSGGPSHFPSYSYIDVLRGQLPPDALRGKYAIVGAVAAGLGDMFATPVGQGSGLMPGVEVVAQVLDAQLSGVALRAATPAANLAVNLTAVAGALLALLFMGPLGGLLTSAAVALGTVLLAIVLPWASGVQLAPAAALVGLLLAYPLWSWRRLSAAAHFLRLEMEHLQQEGLALRLPERATDSSDFLERRINAVERASRQLRELHHFVSESLQQLPSPTLVCDAQGVILLTNAAARHHVGGDAGVSLQGLCVATLLGDLQHSGTRQPLITPQRLLGGGMPEQSEGRDALGRSMLLQCKPFTHLEEAGWLLTLVDITDMRRAQQQRDEAVNFISHDIRAPNASILTLLEMQRAYPDRLSMDELLQRIERYAHTSLGMAESFVQLASAQSQEYRMAPLDLVAMLSETVDDAWVPAREAQVEIVIRHVPPSAPARGDRALLARAVANVLGNAIKYSPEGGTIECAINARGAHWVLSVRDQGPGIPLALQHQLFSPFQRLHDRSHPSIGGIGLGLALVHTVVQRHGGSLEVDSDTGKGAQFSLVLPRAPAPAADGVDG